jgi:hypothetical protein
MQRRVRSQNLWSVVRNAPTVDPLDLLTAVQGECDRGDPDFRTRLLIRDSLRALTGYWGEQDLAARLSPKLLEIRETVERDDLGDRGFPTLARRLMDRTTADDLLALFRDLGRATREPAKMVVGGSSALILRDMLLRKTDDIDAVDEVPSALRLQHELLDELADRYGLRLAHFQSHYLPAGFRNRVASLGVFGLLTVFLVDPVDIFVGKVFSKRTKDLDDLRMLKALLDWPTVVSRLQSSAGPLRAIPAALAAAEHNWYVLTGDPLPGESA